MNKNQAIALINKNDGVDVLTVRNTHWANLSVYGGKEGWWLNVPFDKFRKDLFFILNSEIFGQLLYVYIPPSSINNPRSVFRNKEDTADIFISAVNAGKLSKSDVLIDTQSN